MVEKLKNDSGMSSGDTDKKKRSVKKRRKATPRKATGFAALSEHLNRLEVHLIGEDGKSGIKGDIAALCRVVAGNEDIQTIDVGSDNVLSVLGRDQKSGLRGETAEIRKRVDTIYNGLLGTGDDRATYKENSDGTREAVPPTGNSALGMFAEVAAMVRHMYSWWHPLYADKPKKD